MLYTFGSKGAVVRSIQSKVGAQVTGVWTTITHRKVHDYQKANGLQQTGEVNKETHDHMFPPKVKPKAKPKAEPKVEPKAIESKPAPKKAPPKSTQNGDK